MDTTKEWRGVVPSSRLLSLDSVLPGSLHPETPFRGSLAALQSEEGRHSRLLLHILQAPARPSRRDQPHQVGVMLLGGGPRGEPRLQVCADGGGEEDDPQEDGRSARENRKLVASAHTPRSTPRGSRQRSSHTLSFSAQLIPDFGH